MNCAICVKPGDLISLKLSRQVAGIESTPANIRLPGAEQHRVFIVEIHAGCVPQLQHRMGFHESIADASCPLCEDTLALEEIRRLSSAARSLVAHRLRNPLFIVTGNLDLLAEGIGGDMNAIREAAAQLDEATTYLFGEPHERMDP